MIEYQVKRNIFFNKINRHVVLGFTNPWRQISYMNSQRKCTIEKGL